MTEPQIPKQLQHPDFRFILVKVKDKRPIEDFWQCHTLAKAEEKWQGEFDEAQRASKEYTKQKPTRVTQYKWDDTLLSEHIKNNGNYGVVCGEGNLVIVDMDKPIEGLEMPQTFTVDTPSNGKHYYFRCPDIKKKIILESEGVHYGEIQAGGNTQIICPGSVAKSKVTQELKQYSISSDIDIAPITLDGIKDLIGSHFKKTAKETAKERMPQNERFTLSIDRLLNLSKFRQRGSEYQGVHPTHGSNGGANFCVNPSKNVWHCFRHECGGGVLELIGMMEGVISCGDKITGDQFNLIAKIGEEKYGMTRVRPATRADLAVLVLQLSSAGKEDEATEIIVNDIVGRNHIHTIRDDKMPEMWIYYEGIYTPHGKTYVLEECRLILGQAYTIQLANRVVNKIMADTYIDAEEFFKANTGEWVCVNNGQLNPLTRELKEFSPKDIHFTKLPVDYKPDADCPAIKAHFKEVTSHESDIKVLEEATGWFLLNEYKPERAIMLNGFGRNGKGKTILMWKEFLGIESVATIPLQEFEKDQYAAGDLLNKRANLAGDIDNETLKNTALFKQVTGRDPISSNRKYLSRIKFNNNAKMICACNELPHTKDMSVGFFGRWVLVDFPYRFCTKQELDTLPEEEKKKAKIADLDIINKLTTPGELSGLLNLGIEGLHRLLKQNDFSTTKTTEQVKTEWLRRSDSFGAFILEFLEEDFGGFISKQELRQVYGKWCQQNKLRVSTDRAVKEKLSEALGVFEAKRSVNAGDRQNVWEGVKWKGVKGVKDVKGFPKSLHTQENSFTELPVCLDTLDTPASQENVSVAVGSREDYFSILDYIDRNPMCGLDFIKRLGIFNSEEIVRHLVRIGKVSESRFGQYDLVSRRVD